MTPPPLCIIQARLESSRLKHKMLCTLGGETLIARGWRLACEAFGRENVIVAIPASDAPGPLYDELQNIGAVIFYHGMLDERDVLGRFWRCAHKYRWHPSSVIHRWTPDDWQKSPEVCRLVAAGWRYPVEIGGEAFTLAMLDEAQSREAPIRPMLVIGSPTPIGHTYNPNREHITHALFPTGAVAMLDTNEVWTIDTEADLLAARRIVEGA